jgi:histidinol dehydrogenase
MSIMIRQLDASLPDFDDALRELLKFDASFDATVEQAVTQILADVKIRGDAAVLDYTKQFDQLEADCLQALEIPPSTLAAAADQLAPHCRSALETAAARIEAFHRQQKIKSGLESWEYTDAEGIVLGQKVQPLDRVGIYVPGGRAAYPSSVLMNAIPARIAGVSEIIMVVPTPAGEKNPLVLAAAHLAGINRIFTIGGAQAIGALAYGTQTLPAVDKIVGPGNAYVAAAKRRVFGVVGIDMIAGPSEILILCDGTTDPHWIALDLCAQAEHDEKAQAILLCPDTAFIGRIAQEIAQLLPDLPRRAVICASLEARGALIKVRDMDEACALANEIAPEHLEISAREPRRWMQKIRHAGAIFLGPLTSESLGDYCAGPNHVLPTARTARFSSPLGVYDFVKRSSLIEMNTQGANTLGRIAAELAEGEGLHAHAKSARCRIA